MHGPYRLKEPMASTLLASYDLNRETIKRDAYRLLCLFYANKEISRLSDPNRRDDAASQLERSYFGHEVSQLLIGIAISLRVLDDQMRSMPPESDERQRYEKLLNEVNHDFRCMLFDDGLTLRDTCNKIIHATTVEPHFQDGHEAHEHDDFNWIGWDSITQRSKKPIPEPDPVKWKHLNAYIRLGGHKNKKQWWHLLEVPTFVDAVYFLFER